MALPPKLRGHRYTFNDSISSNTHGEPLALHTLEFYLDYVCPFSAKIFKTLNDTVIPYIRGNPSLASHVQLIVRPQIQPWHPSSTLVHEAALAVQRLTLQEGGDGNGKFWAFLRALFEDQAAYFDEAVVDESRNQTYRRLADLAQRSAGVSADEVYALLEVKRLPAEAGASAAKNAGNQVTADVKTIVKMARLTGVHVTPTVLFDGVVAGEISSGWTGEQWQKWLGEHIQ
ncbi:hypothetical protein C7999DRAFT_34581 [Corynascus novoguineensis]|uniref:Thioredoxin-like fold domain-containing protein n=1 Tax=Corynascus novoguineensis TaxID=1126955 RepID=A0AAN7CMZ3_9PEZI|nr:hypothetical protein C7999DRAFT_34581 [Corynascus novoguineensis]